MIGQTISHYKILEKLGEGGMGVVYKAEDIKLKRTVALKFLPPEWTRDLEAKARFMHEAQAASALQHNNICTIHEIDETDDGQMFICMDYYEGETVRQKIERGPLKLEEAVNLAIQIAEGLDKAHQKTIVHRDLKPANLLVTEDGIAKILDFGLAKLAGRTRLTKDDTTLGTVAYMSPEQAQATEVDHRTDIWALGAILYEMITGRQPFAGDYEQAVMYAIMNEDPEPITALRTGVPMELEQALNKALAKNPEERYQHVDELLTDLRRVQKTAAPATPRHRQAIAKPGPRKWLASPVLWTFIIVVFGLAGGVLLFYPSKTIPFSARDWILITDFENLTGEDVFDRSLNTALTVSIQQSNYVNVFPRSRLRETLKRMQKTKVDTLDEALGCEIALREGIRVVVVPSINRIGETYALSAQVVDPNSRVTLETNTTQAKSQDEILAALDDLAEKIRNNLGESLAAIAMERVPLPRATTSSLQALKSFSEGAVAWDSGKYHEAAALWQEAIQKDSSFAWAHASLGGYFYWHSNRPDGEAHFAKVDGLLDRLTEREKLWIQSWIKGWRGDYEGSIKELNIYLSKYPDDRDAWHNLGNEYRSLKQFEDALSAYGKALDLDPYMASAFINVATCYNATQRYSEAIPNYLRAFELQPDWITSGNLNHEFGFAYVATGEFKKAEEIFRKMLAGADWQKARGHRSLALLDMYLGRYSTAIEHLKEAILYNQTANSTLSEVRDRLYLASSYQTKGLPEEVNEQLRAIEKLQRETYLDPWWLTLAGKLYVRLGMIREATSMLDSISSRVNEANRSDKACLNLLKGELELARADHDEAVRLFEIAYKLREDNYVLQSLAHGYFVKGDLDRARAKYELLISKEELGWEAQECWINAHYQLGKVCEQTGDVENAIKYYARFSDIWKDADEDLPELIDAKKRLVELKLTTKK